MTRLVLCAAAMLLLAACSSPAQKKSYTFHGKVEAVHKETLVVNGENIDGWMEAMTMEYKLDNPAILAQLKPGDRITATVYDGDYTLHHVQKDSTK